MLYSSSLETAGVEQRARLDELVEQRVALEHDQRADALLRQRGRGLDHLFDHLRLERGPCRRQQGPATEAHQRAANVLLKDDDDDQHQRGQQGVEHRVERDQAQALGDLVHDEDERQADAHLHRARALDQQQHVVEDTNATSAMSARSHSTSDTSRAKNASSRCASSLTHVCASHARERPARPSAAPGGSPQRRARAPRARRAAPQA